MTDPHKDEHIEELLSKLQGIFGKLSHSEEETGDPTIQVPVPAPQEFEKRETAPPPTTPEPAKPEPPAPLNFYAEPPAALPPAPADPAPPPAPVVSTAAYDTTVPVQDPEKTIVPTAVYFPPGREAEAKSLAQKLETMTPKFTKVAFRLRVVVFLPYDPKSEWKDAVIARAAEAKFQTVFVVIDRALDDARRKTIASELEARGVYFQEVLTPSIEKKAFYTDVLLGLVFFFDSRRPSAESGPPTP
jgi:hypothetical protein